MNKETQFFKIFSKHSKNNICNYFFKEDIFLGGYYLHLKDHHHQNLHLHPRYHHHRHRHPLLQQVIQSVLKHHKAYLHQQFHHCHHHHLQHQLSHHHQNQHRLKTNIIAKINSILNTHPTIKQRQMVPSLTKDQEEE